MLFRSCCTTADGCHRVLLHRRDGRCRQSVRAPGRVDSLRRVPVAGVRDRALAAGKGPRHKVCPRRPAGCDAAQLARRVDRGFSSLRGHTTKAWTTIGPMRDYSLRAWTGASRDGPSGSACAALCVRLCQNTPPASISAKAISANITLARQKPMSSPGTRKGPK